MYIIIFVIYNWRDCILYIAKTIISRLSLLPNMKTVAIAINPYYNIYIKVTLQNIRGYPIYALQIKRQQSHRAVLL